MTQSTQLNSLASRVKFSPVEIETQSLSSQTLTAATELFERDGVLWLENMFDADFIQQLRKSYFENYVSLSTRQLKKRHATVGDKRFMVTVKIRGPFNSPALYANPKLTPILQNLLGPGFRISSFGSVFTRPTADAQPIHFDHPPLFQSESACNRLPPHAITVVIPLVNIDLETGPTAVWPGSHNRAGARDEMVALMEAPSFERAACPLPRLGDVYLMDYRLIHGGMPNRSETARPILYIVYSRPWFRDGYNFSEQPPVLISDKQLKKVPKHWRHLFR